MWVGVGGEQRCLFSKAIQSDQAKERGEEESKKGDEKKDLLS